MAKFIFRAQAALDLRRKQEDAARLALAEAQARLREAEEALARSEGQVADALARARNMEAEAADPTLAIWYRNWIHRLRREVARCVQILDGRQADAKAAEARIAAGTPFEKVAEERKISAASLLLGTLSKAYIPDEARADAIFALPLNKVSDPVKGALSGYVLFRVTKITPGIARTLDDLTAKTFNLVGSHAPKVVVERITRF